MRCKICPRCKEQYSSPTDSFHKGGGTDGLASVCKACRKVSGKNYRVKNKDKIKQYNREYRTKNKVIISIRDKKYYANNTKKIRERSRNYYCNNQPKIKAYYEKNKEIRSEKHKKWLKDNADHVRQYIKERNLRNKEHQKIINRQYHAEHRERLNAKSRKYYSEHKTEIKKYVKHRKMIDPTFRIRMNLSGRIRQLLKRAQTSKCLKTIELLGCSMNDFKKYIEGKFLPGMNWENYGSYGWHVDHIVPCAAFDLTKKEEQIKCFHYENLQPLWWMDNFSKGSFYNGKAIRRCGK